MIQGKLNGEKHAFLIYVENEACCSRSFMWRTIYRHVLFHGLVGGSVS